nr:MAG TPA: nucelotide kinase [Caudoviricetes sp.]
MKEINDGNPETSTHYMGAVQPIELMLNALSREEFIGFLKGNMIKYAFRAGRKEGESAEKDRNKYLTYADWLYTFENFDNIEVNGEYIEKGKING